jgi:hypothetical protein
LNHAPGLGLRILNGSFLFTFFCCAIAATFSDTRILHAGQAPPFKLLSPAQDQVVIAKKPRIQVAFSQPMEEKSLLVMLDGIDISQVLTSTADGFSYQPIQVLQPGPHILMISGATVRGESVNQEFLFSTRHYKNLEKGFSENQLTVLGQAALGRSESRDDQIPDKRLEAGLRTNSQVREKGFDLAFNANLKFIDQDIPAVAPEKKGLDLIDFLMAADYVRGSMQTHAEFGDTQLDLSKNTLSYLVRRGAQLSMGSEIARVGGFSLNSSQTYGYDGGLGVSNDLNRHMHGVYGDLNLLDKRMRLRAIYTTGGEQGDGFGTIGLEDRNTQGNAAGLVLTTDFFQGRLVSEFEFNSSRFDADTTDDQAAESDNACRMEIQGSVDRYTYGAAYKYFGPNYEVVGNQGLEKDRAGFELNGGAGFEKHSLSLAFSSLRDNVDNDGTRPVLQTRTAAITYSYMGLERWPLSLAYQREASESSREPDGLLPVDYHMDTVSGTIGYIYNQWNISLQGNYGLMDDLTANDADTTNIMVALMPQFFTEAISVSPNLCYNQAKDHASGIQTDSYTVSMSIQGQFLDSRLAYGLGGTLDFTSTSDDLMDQQTRSYYFNLDYKLGDFLRGSITPAIGLRGESNEIHDRTTDQTTRDYAFLLTLSVGVLGSF